MIKLIVRRIIEVIGVMILLSALVTALDLFGVFKNADIVFYTDLAITVVYIAWTVWCLYKFRVVFDGKKDFFMINAPIYLTMFAGAIVTGIFDTEPVYTYLFFPFKLVHYLAMIWRFPGAGRVGRPLSAVIMSIVIAIPVIIIPFYLSTARKTYIKKVG